MRYLFAAPLVFGCVVVACSKSAAPESAPAPDGTLASDLRDAQGKVVAKARVTPRGTDSVSVVIEATDALPAGTHGVHLHAKGLCEGPTFATAGPHLNPKSRKHGLQNPEGPHAGDMPNLFGAKGTFVAAASIEQLTGPDGSAIVIHAARDDQATDPSGNSGARIACGVLSAPKAAGTAP
jgi:superoxide dismutase, Cu-Zn family